MSNKIKNKKGRITNLIAYNEPRSHMAEQYRLIRTNIEFSSIDKQVKTIMVTSAEPSEGKTTTASNLAIVFAQQEKTVLLIDADLRKPTVHYSFKLENSQGLTTVLTNRTNIEATIHKGEIDNLDILTSGPIPPDPSLLLNSKALVTMIKALKLKYDYIIIDTPPVLAVADSQILANKCDGVVMVIGSGKTNKTKIVKAKESLVRNNANLLGAVLNGSKSQDQKSYNYELN
ncbi:CpsD/CapB family tyrosine-protein kinase [Priestia aryabhattai]|uniref:CpsD/CapB family tyrosine-protein kinase n=1 Tax=Priestia TaxID=2800373 RepID=UPI00263B11EA|nr:CpsD/CapB family tyrosine-protein kinase [Priestia megaterium]MDN4861142.1 CpsD/CapB family tyrosine-protein kinase [Priestia megaterium]